MVKLPFRPWRRQPPIVVFMLAVTLPAAALVIASGFYLRHIQRGKMIDAEIQRDYRETLAIAEKRITDRAFEIAERDQATFPGVDDTDALDDFLRTHPDIAHAFIWTGKDSMTFRSQPDRMSDPDFRAEGKKLATELGGWFDLDSEEHIAKVKSFEAAEGRRVFLMAEPHVMRGDKLEYETFAYFIPRGSSSGPSGTGWVCLR